MGQIWNRIILHQLHRAVVSSRYHYHSIQMRFNALSIHQSPKAPTSLTPYDHLHKIATQYTPPFIS